MDVAVGSENPVKIAATEQALGERFDANVRAVGVDSGISEQPRGREETITGAENRARRALAEADASLGVGIEGGVAAVAGTPGLCLIMWAAVTDGEQWGHGAGPTLVLPGEIADSIRGGEELGPVMDDLLHTDGIARGQGAAGALTDGAIDRESALTHAVAGALGPFVTELYGSDE